MESDTEYTDLSAVETININRICRFCADIDTKLYPIFENKIELKVQCLVPIKVMKDDGLPSMICALCKYKLNTAYEFRILAASVDRKLRELLLQDDLPEETESITKELENIYSPVTNVKYQPTDNEENKETKTLSVTKVEFELSAIQNIIEERVKDEIDNTKMDELVKKRYNKSKCNLNVECPECGRIVKRHCLNDHMKTHTRIADKECLICGEMFLTRSRLWQHKRNVHNKKELYNCDKCGKTFNTNSCFRRHYKHVHLKIKKYKCDVCNQAFSLPKTLLHHKQTHTGDRPYICHYCGRGMSSPYALRQHIRLHTNEAPFKCEQCGEGFKQRVTMKLHYRRQHLGITPDQEKLAKLEEAANELINKNSDDST